MRSMIPPHQENMMFGRPSLFQDLLGAGRESTVPARGTIYEPGDMATRVYVILEGQVRTLQVGPAGSRRLLEILGPGDWFGLAALGHLQHYNEEAQTPVDTRVVEIPVEEVVHYLEGNAGRSVELIRQLAQKLNQFHEEAAGLVFTDCKKRLVHTLQRLSDSPAASRSGEEVTLRITHQQLAQAVGVARETVSLALSELRRRNLLRTGRNQLMFNPSRLDENN